MGNLIAQKCYSENDRNSQSAELSGPSWHKRDKKEKAEGVILTARERTQGDRTRGNFPDPEKSRKDYMCQPRADTSSSLLATRQGQSG